MKEKKGIQIELQQIFQQKQNEIEQNVNTSSQIQFEHVFLGFVIITLNIN